MRVYLAGPEVFLADAEAVAAAKKAVCAAHGLTGVFPGDHHAGPEAIAAEAAHMRIYLTNEAHIRGCDAMIANLTPFRGPSADAGTIFEIGFMRALGRPIFAYANTLQGFAARTLSHLGPQARRRPAGEWEDEEGMALEDFDLFDNLMVDGGIATSGGVVELAEVPRERRWQDIGAFSRCVARLAALGGG